MPAERGPAFLRSNFVFRIPLVGVLDQAGAITYLAGFTPGYRGEIEKVWYIPDVAGAGAGAAQTLEIRKGAANGTIVATVALTLANHVLGGAGLSGAVSAANDETAKFRDSDTISITKAAGGTVFSGGGGTLWIMFRQRPQARA